MANLPSTEKQNKPVSIKKMDAFQFHVVSEAQHMLMVVLFFISAFAIVFYIQITLISLLKASQLFIEFGLIGFLITYLIRQRFGLSVLDGLYYNVFMVAPIITALFFVINSSTCTDSYTETHEVIGFTAEGKGYTVRLKDDAYKDFWRIRNLEGSPVRRRTAVLKLTLCDGVFGYKTIKAKELE
ncbi:MAG: hypothetical protein GC178_13280 [Flavobacteriales bacterium]|nr:hypothetical protein [Flavobacteriales bacterium]